MILPDKKTTTEREYWNEQWAGLTRISPIGKGISSLMAASRRWTSVFKKYLPRGDKRLLEIGCATGRYLEYFHREFGYEIRGVDYSEAGCKLAEDYLTKQGVKGQITCADAFDPMFRNQHQGYFDITCSFGMIEHFLNPTDFIRLHLELTREDGLIVMTFPNYSEGSFYRWVEKLTGTEEELLNTHNVELMKLVNLEKYLAKFQELEIQMLCYFGPVDIPMKMLPLRHTKFKYLLHLFNQAIGYATFYLSSRILSPNIILIGRKRSRTMVESYSKLPKKVRLVFREDFIVERCKDKKVLHLGCVNAPLTRETVEQGNLLHLKIMKVAKVLYGIDSDEPGIEVLKEAGVPNIIMGDVERLNEIPFPETFDLVVAGELIEHLANPGNFLKNANKFLTEQNAEMLITVPNAWYWRNFLAPFKKIEEVNPTHNFWYSFATLNSFLKRNDYQITEFYVYKYRGPTLQDLKNNLRTLPPFYRRRKAGHREPERTTSGGSTIGKYIEVALYLLLTPILQRLSPHFAPGLIFVVKPIYDQ